MSQTSKLKDLLKDCQPHRTDEIMRIVYGSEHLGLARVGARIWDLKRQGIVINGWSDEKIPSLFWYQMTPVKTYEPQTIAGYAFINK